MQTNFRKIKSIIHIVLLILTAIFGGLIANYKCLCCTLKQDGHTGFFQFVNATAGGFFIVLCVMFVGMFFAEELERKTLTVSYTAGIFHFLAIYTLACSYFEEKKEVQTLMGMIFCSLLALCHIVEAVTYSVKKRASQEEA